MRNSRHMPKLNAGSMADIAFLLLIFFLVTTTIPNDKGIARKLPAKCPPGIDCSTKLKEKNILRIFLNEYGELFVDDNLIAIDQLHKTIVDFVDNNGDGSCDYCNGNKDVTSSDHPTKAVVSLSTDRLTPYTEFIRVQDEISEAYFLLRQSFITDQLGTTVEAASEEEMKQVAEAYPILISEAFLE